MALVHVGVGQCGVSLLDAIRQLDGEAARHCVLVDGEPRVIKRTLQRHDKRRTTKVAALAGHDGCANNFALGYLGRSELVDEARDLVRKAAEATGSFAGCWLWHSAAGGSGSGVGSRLLESLRDDFGRRYLISTLVLPFDKVGSPVRRYNSILAAHTVQRTADAVVVLNNDSILELASKLHESPCFAEMNSVTATSMLGMLCPYEKKSGGGCGLRKNSRWRGFDVGKFVTYLAPMQSCNLVQVWNVHGLSPWNRLADRLGACIRKYQAGTQRVTTLVGRITARGAGLESFEAEQKNVQRILQRRISIAAWMGKEAIEYTSSAWRVPSQTDQSLTAVLNTSAPASDLIEMCNAAKLQLDANAFVHWYERYGYDREMIVHAIEDLRRTMSVYEEMART